MDLLDAKEERLDSVQVEIAKERVEIFKNAQQNFDGEITLSCKECDPKC